MKISWLENLVKEGHVRPSARDAIYEDCSSLLKLGLDWGNPEEAGKFVQDNANVIPAALATATAVYIAGKKIYSKIVGDKPEMKRTAAAQAAARAVVGSHPDFAANKEKALARYDELWKIAPAVALNPDLVVRILKGKVNSGFTNQDIQNLALIQATYVPNVAAGMKMTSSVKTASQVRLGETYATIIGMVKEGSAASLVPVKMKDVFIRSALNTAALLAIPTILSVGSGVTNEIVATRNKKKLQEDLTHSFAKAIALEPADSDMHQQKSKAQQAFELLAHFAPHVALQPVAAHAYIRKILNYGDIAGHELEHIKTMADIQKNYHGSSQFMEGFSAAARNTGFNSIIGGQIQALAKPMDAEIDMMGRAALDLPEKKGKEDR